MHRFCRALVAVLILMAPAPVALAQSGETLADIRQQMSVLHFEIQRLRRELSTTEGAAGVSSGGSLIDRVAGIESELQRLTAKTEELEFRIERIVRDGSNRLEDLEFRVCELDSGCDIGTWTPGQTLGGDTDTTGGDGGTVAQLPLGGIPDNGANGDSPQLAVGEQADYDAAVAALEAGQYGDAAQRFGTFRQAYPGGPLTMRAWLLQGVALESDGQVSDAERVYLDTFSADQTGPMAPDALYRLGVALGKLNKVSQACVTLAEVENRFPVAEAVTDAREAMTSLGCQ